MLSGLSIQNVVLIDRLTLEGRPGLCALTGETGAGKSILLDALGLALGARADAALVRAGTEQATVSAAFDLSPGHPLRAELAARGIPAGDEIVLRRVLSRDGRGKAFINDEPVSVQTLRDVGAALVEIHGQFDTHGLLDPATHRDALDAHAGTLEDANRLALLWEAWREAREAVIRARAEAETAEAQRDFLAHAVAELDALAPLPGEDAALAGRRASLLNAEKTKAARDEAAALLDSEDGARVALGRIDTLLGRLGPEATPMIEGLSRARAELEEVSYALSRLGTAGGAGRLAEIEDRYFALKACAKRHRCTPDDLPALHADLAARLRLIDGRDDALAALSAAADKARAAYVAAGERLSAQRGKAALTLARGVQAELPALKLDKARFHVDVVRADEDAWGRGGLDRIAFLVSTNPQAAPGPLHKIASGGELARFTLALKAVLAAAGGGPQTLVFDEVDTGIGGAVADAVGERLARLAHAHQVLVVTHSPQVAARAAHHWHVSKAEGPGGAVLTRVAPLPTIEARREEIARMLSGAEVTAEARAQAARLLERAEAA